MSREAATTTIPAGVRDNIANVARGIEYSARRGYDATASYTALDVICAVVDYVRPGDIDDALAARMSDLLDQRESIRRDERTP